jgi:hypothetical protein
MPHQVHTLEAECRKKLTQPLYLRRIAIRSGLYPGACAPARLVRRDYVIAPGQWLGKTVPTVGRGAKSMQQDEWFAVAALGINDAMVANLDYVASVRR